MLDGLNATAMNRSYGGTNINMRETYITSEIGYLGPFPRTVCVGDKQEMKFGENDVGPYWMTSEERTKRKFEQGTGSEKTRKK